MESLRIGILGITEFPTFCEVSLVCFYVYRSNYTLNWYRTQWVARQSWPACWNVSHFQKLSFSVQNTHLNIFERMHGDDGQWVSPQGVAHG